MALSGISVKKKASRIQNPGQVRRAADKRVQKKDVKIDSFREEDVTAVVQEYKVHELELQMQNKNLQHAKDEAQEALCKYSDLFDFAPIGYFSLSEEGSILEVNHAGAYLLGVKRHLLVKRLLQSFIAVDSRDAFVLFRKRLFETGTRQSGEFILLKNREEQIHAYIEGIAAETKAGTGRQFLIAVMDITRRKQAEEEIMRLNTELEERIKDRTSELEAFSYSVSHDLRDPLRHIEGFTKALMEDYSDRFDETGKDYFSRILNATARISNLVNALTRLSRLSAWQLNHTDVDLSDIAEAIANDLKRSSPDRKVEFIIPEDVKAWGDAEMLQAVLENLIGNSWKFTERHPHARIEFGTTSLKGKVIYFVRDDGAGFDMTYSNKLFLPFHRLHQRSAFPGIGIGLATVKRIVERHGGRIWAESAVEKGATFYFTLSEKTPRV